MATHSGVLAWRIPMDRGSWWATVHGVAKSRTTTERLSTAQYMFDPGFLNLTTTDSWDLSLFCCGLGWGLFYALQDIKRISHLYTLDASSALLAVTTKNVSRQCQMSPGRKWGAKLPPAWLRTSGLSLSCCYYEQEFPSHVRLRHLVCKGRPG